MIHSIQINSGDFRSDPNPTAELCGSTIKAAHVYSAPKSPWIRRRAVGSWVCYFNMFNFLLSIVFLYTLHKLMKIADVHIVLGTDRVHASKWGNIASTKIMCLTSTL